MAFKIFILNVYVCFILYLPGTTGTIFDLIKEEAISNESYLWSARVRSAIECSSVCQSNSGCKATNYIDGTCDLHKSQDCPFEYNSSAVAKNESAKAYVKRENSSKGENNQINWMEHGAEDCYDGYSHDYRGHLNRSYVVTACQAWNANDPHVVLEKPLNQSDHSTNYCRATEMNGDIWCAPNTPEDWWAETKCNVVLCSQCNLKSSIPNAPHNSKPGKLSAIFHPLVTYECDSFSSGDSVEHCPVSTCKDNKWSLNFSLSCSYADCYNVSYEYKGKMSCTVSGIPCQKWNTNTPHRVFHLPRDTEDLDTNYCRDNPNLPDGAPWCYTVDPRVRWQYCPVPKCIQCDPCHLRSPPPNTKRSISKIGIAVLECESFNTGASVEYCPVSTCSEKGWSTAMVSCSSQDCYNESSTYRGKISCTRTGLPCQRWNESSPHIPDVPSMDSGDIGTNYCRDLDGTGTPWCYTTDPNIRWEYCPVQKCH